jgi:hypothetical protein
VAGKTLWNPTVSCRCISTLSVVALNLLASRHALALRSPASDPSKQECVPAQTSVASKMLPPAWQAALAALLASTAESGQPWSCAGGRIELELVPAGALLWVAREGEAATVRTVSTPQDVLPLGQALLATALPEADDPTLPSEATAEGPVPASASSEPQPDLLPAEEPVREPAVAGSPQPAAESGKSRRGLLLAAGLDVRGVGRSDVMWLGPTATAGVVLGRWLPTLGLRGLSDVVSRRPTVDELSVACALQHRWVASGFELRLGAALRAAAVERHLPERRGEQVRLEGRVGALAAIVIPVALFTQLAFSADAEALLLARKPVGATQLAGDEAAVPFPGFTIGGNATLEFGL